MHMQGFAKADLTEHPSDRCIDGKTGINGDSLRCKQFGCSHRNFSRGRSDARFGCKKTSFELCYPVDEGFFGHQQCLCCVAARMCQTGCEAVGAGLGKRRTRAIKMAGNFSLQRHDLQCDILRTAQYISRRQFKDAFESVGLGEILNAHSGSDYHRVVGLRVDQQDFTAVGEHFSKLDECRLSDFAILASHRSQTSDIFAQ